MSDVISSCAFCGNQADMGSFDGAHVIPVCATCDQMKGRMTAAEFLEHVRKISSMMLPEGEFLAGR